MPTLPGGWPSNAARPIHLLSSMRASTLVILFAVAAAACDTRTTASVARTDTARAALGDITLALETRVVSARVRSGATLASLLRAHDVAADETAAIVAQAASVVDLP